MRFYVTNIPAGYDTQCNEQLGSKTRFRLFSRLFCHNLDCRHMDSWIISKKQRRRKHTTGCSVSMKVEVRQATRTVMILFGPLSALIIVPIKHVAERIIKHPIVALKADKFTQTVNVVIRVHVLNLALHFCRIKKRTICGGHFA